MMIIEKIRRYKYLPFDEGSLRIITGGTIKFTPPSELNDPFECSPDVDTSNIADYLNTRPDLLNRAGETLRLSPTQLVKEKPTRRSISLCCVDSFLVVEPKTASETTPILRSSWRCAASFFSSSFFVKRYSRKSNYFTTITCQNYNLYEIARQFEI